MVLSTRAKQKMTLAHIVGHDVLMLDNDNPLSLALANAYHIIDIYDVLAMPFQDINLLEYVDGKGNTVILPSGYQYMVVWIIKH